MSSDLASRVERKIDVRNKRKLDGKGQFWLVFRYIALTILFVIAALPIYIMVINSVKGITGVTQSAAFIPPTKLDFSAWGPTWEILKEPISHRLFLQLSALSMVSSLLSGASVDQHLSLQHSYSVCSSLTKRS
jgi:glucose/mannose transport system permease protein